MMKWLIILSLCVVFATPALASATTTCTADTVIQQADPREYLVHCEGAATYASVRDVFSVGAPQAGWVEFRHYGEGERIHDMIDESGHRYMLWSE